MLFIVVLLYLMNIIMLFNVVINSFDFCCGKVNKTIGNSFKFSASRFGFDSDFDETSEESDNNESDTNDGKDASDNHEESETNDGKDASNEESETNEGKEESVESDNKEKSDENELVNRKKNILIEELD